jgi:GAF domain-containing protein
VAGTADQAGVDVQPCRSRKSTTGILAGDPALRFGAGGALRQDYPAGSADVRHELGHNILLGRDRQFVKSSTGPLGADLPRDRSFCSHTIDEDRTLVIPDATIDSRFADNELVHGTARLRFYAGHPLSGPGGWRIGAFCILDTEPRTFTEQDRQALRVLANLAQRELIAP